MALNPSSAAGKVDDPDSSVDLLNLRCLLGRGGSLVPSAVMTLCEVGSRTPSPVPAPGEPWGAAQAGSQDGRRGYGEGECDGAVRGHGGGVVVSIICGCRTNQPSGLKQQIIPSHGSEGSRLCRQVLLQVLQDVAVGCPFGLHLKTQQSWTHMVLHTHDLELMLDAQLGQPDRRHLASPCGFAQHCRWVPQESILRANVSKGSSWKYPCDPASEVTGSPFHQTPRVKSKSQASPDSKAVDCTRV